MTDELHRLRQTVFVLRNSFAAMQGNTFYCEDGDGMLRRWTPPTGKTIFDTAETARQPEGDTP